MRDIGVPVVSLATILYLGYFHWTMLLTAPIMFGSMTSYWTRKNAEHRWYNWFATGFFYSFSTMPIALAYHREAKCFWISVLLGALTACWSQNVERDVNEEMGRGFLTVAAIIAIFWQ
jgi:hypothetical protein